MKFSEMQYRRPDVGAIIRDYRELAQKVCCAGSGSELVSLFRRHIDLNNSFYTAASLSSIRYTLDTRNGFYAAERNFFDRVSPDVGNAKLTFYKALLNSPFKDALADEFGAILPQKLKLEIDSSCDEILDLMKENNELVSRYQKLYAGCGTEFDGKYRTIPGLGLYKQVSDRSVRKAAFEAEGRVFDSHREELDEIYSRMIENRNKQAQMLGYDNYVPLSYLRMGRIGYGPEDVKNFRDQIARDVTPLAHKAMKAQYERTGISDPKFYDDSFSFADGNAVPCGSADQLLAHAAKMYRELSPETAQFIDFMTESELFDLTTRSGKAPGGYMRRIPAYGAPFIFSNFNGTMGDVKTLTHEAGHAFAAWTASQKGVCPELVMPGLESCEIHSMSMEFLTAPWHHLFFAGDARTTAKYELHHAQNALTFLPYGCMVDEFQHIIYAQPHLTPDERNKVWLELEHKYRPWVDFEDLPFYSRGAGWQRQLHVYQYPFYYIDYCLAQMVALQFFAAHLADPADAWQRYLALVDKCGTQTYAGLVKSAGFAVPFEDGAILPAVSRISDWISEQNSALNTL